MGRILGAILLCISMLALALPSSAEPLNAVQADRVRIRLHLARVEVELRAADVSQLGPRQRKERARNIERLKRYRARGVFPHNTDFPGRRVPYFIDTEGRACAVADLMIESGAGQLARRIARNENNARVREMRTPGIADWVQSSGLSVDECARIQPGYCNQDSCHDAGGPVCGKSGRSYWCLAHLECSRDEYAYDGECLDAGPDGGDDDAGPTPVVTPSKSGCQLVPGIGGEAPWLGLSIAFSLMGWRRRRRRARVGDFLRRGEGG